MDYVAYILAEWQDFFDDPKRPRVAREVIAERSVAAVLDIGCGGGHELIPFEGPGVLRVGVDVAPQIGRVPWGDGCARPEFVRGSGNALPFADGAFDVAICRMAIAYMDTPVALREM